MASRGCAGVVGVVFLVGSWALAGLASSRADQILAQARQAIGGEARLKAVRSLSLKGVAEARRESAAGVVTNLQIDFLLPDRFRISRDWFAPSFFRRVGGFNGGDLVEQRQASGVWTDVGFGKGSKEASAWQMAARKRECARYLVAWLLMAPEQYGVQFTDPAGESGDGSTDVVDARGANDFAARLFFDKNTHRLLKLTYREAVPGAPATGAPPAGRQAAGRGEPLFNSLERSDSKTDEVTMQFDDYHTDDGILFSHTTRVESEGLREEWRISRFKVNPQLDAKYFERKKTDGA